MVTNLSSNRRAHPSIPPSPTPDWQGTWGLLGPVAACWSAGLRWMVLSLRHFPSEVSGWELSGVIWTISDSENIKSSLKPRWPWAVGCKLCDRVWQGQTLGERVCLENVSGSPPIQESTYSFTHSFTQQIFTETLLCAKHCPGCWYAMVSKKNIVPSLRQFTV